MKKLLLSFSVFLLVHQLGLSCSFHAEETAFCQLGQLEELLIARGKIIDVFDHGLLLQLYEVYRGEESRCEIKIFNRPDWNCTGVNILSRSENFGEPGQTVLFFAPKVLEPTADYEELGEYRNDYIEYEGYGRPFRPLVHIGNHIEGLFSDGVRSVRVERIHEKLRSCDFKNLLHAPRKICGEHEINVYSNPQAHSLTLLEEVPEQADLILMDLSGRQMLSVPAPPKGTILPVNHLPTGIYILLIKSEGILFKQKVLL
ncbi:MAG: T9SS type A sorting domain-containing protein [Bacteroidota bacterium]